MLLLLGPEQAPLNGGCGIESVFGLIPNNSTTYLAPELGLGNWSRNQAVGVQNGSGCYLPSYAAHWVDKTA